MFPTMSARPWLIFYKTTEWATLDSQHQLKLVNKNIYIYFIISLYMFQDKNRRPEINVNDTLAKFTARRKKPLVRKYLFQSFNFIYVNTPNRLTVE